MSSTLFGGGVTDGCVRPRWVMNGSHGGEKKGCTFFKKPEPVFMEELLKLKEEVGWWDRMGLWDESGRRDEPSLALSWRQEAADGANRGP